MHGQVERAIRTEVARKPFGIGEVIGGHRFPAPNDHDLSDAERIAALENAVCSLCKGLMRVGRFLD